MHGVTADWLCSRRFLGLDKSRTSPRRRQLSFFSILLILFFFELPIKPGARSFPFGATPCDHLPHDFAHAVSPPLLLQFCLGRSFFRLGSPPSPFFFTNRHLLFRVWLVACAGVEPPPLSIFEALFFPFITCPSIPHGCCPCFFSLPGFLVFPPRVGLRWIVGRFLPPFPLISSSNRNLSRKVNGFLPTSPCFCCRYFLAAPKR